MAYDKVIDSELLEADLTTVADAIREKGGTSETLIFPDGFVSAVKAISGSGAILTVTAPSGVTVEVSKDGEVKTQTSNADGLAVFKGLATGTWTLTITDGVQTNTKPVSVTADYSTVIIFFSATINITYPAGSTCTCSDGSTTLTAPDTSGTWACVVPNAGTWTVSCTDGTESKSETVTITADGQSFAVELAYWNGDLYKAGNEYEAITGGWQARGWQYDSGCSPLKPKLEKTDSYMVLGTTGSGIQSGIVEIAKDLDFTKYTKITVNVSDFPNVSDNLRRNRFMVYKRDATYPTSTVAHLLMRSFVNGDNVLDISNVSGSYALGFFLIEPNITFKVNLVRVS